MMTLERMLIAFTNALCGFFEVTPEHLKKLQDRQARGHRRDHRPDCFKA